MATSITLAVMLALSGVVTPGTPGPETEKQETPEHQVVAIYFHRTERCPTCKRIGAMSEGAVTKGFQKEVKTRGVEFHFIDFQDKKNAKLVEAYGIDSPTLLLLNVFEGETECHASLPKVWQLVGKPDEFRAYVQQGVVHYLTQTKEAAQKERAKSKESKE
jgi:hypothetical protein